MVILAIDTSSLNTSVAILREGEDRPVVCVDHFEPSYQQSKVIFSLIERLLNESNTSAHEVRALAAGTGPGSYTGLRVGLAIVKMWAFSKSLPVYSFRSQEVAARSSPLSLKFLDRADLRPLADVSDLNPEYEGDHFR